MYKQQQIEYRCELIPNFREEQPRWTCPGCKPSCELIPNFMEEQPPAGMQTADNSCELIPNFREEQQNDDTG